MKQEGMETKENGDKGERRKKDETRRNGDKGGKSKKEADRRKEQGGKGG